jgi:hypothetical protein
MTGGGAYALVDNPRLQKGPRQWTFDGKNYPQRSPNNVTNIVPYLKIGALDGPDQAGNAPEQRQATDRWSFSIGDGVPQCFRIGVITDGLDSVDIAPGQIFIRRVGTDPIGSAILTRNRFVDIHFFDIQNAKVGDEFVVSAAPGSNPIGAAVSGFTFDISDSR